MKTIKEINQEAKSLLKRIKSGESKEDLIMEFESFIDDVSNVLGGDNPFVELLKEQLNQHKERLQSIKSMKENLSIELQQIREYRISAGLSI